MFKYGNSRPLNYISNSTNRNIVYKTSDKITGNASTASAWKTPITLSLSGDVTGSVSINGSKNVTLTTLSSTKVYITDNETANDNNFLTFVSDTGNHTLEMNENLHYNPSLETLTSTNFSGTINQVEQNSITTMDSLTSIGSAGNATTIKGPIVFNEGFGAGSNVLTVSQDITSGGTYIVNNAASIDLTLGSLTTGTLITLYGGGVSDYTLTGVDAITNLNGITINNQDKKLAIPKTSTEICIATGTDSWVAYVDGTYPEPS